MPLAETEPNTYLCASVTVSEIASEYWQLEKVACVGSGREQTRIIATGNRCVLCSCDSSCCVVVMVHAMCCDSSCVV